MTKSAKRRGHGSGTGAVAVHLARNLFEVGGVLLDESMICRGH
jgi:hypothetical protein